MKIGYACLTVGVANTNFKTLRQKSLNEENLKKIIKHNLRSLLNIIDYNAVHEIKLFRITSDLIPFGSSELNGFDWAEYFIAEFQEIGRKIKKYGMRVSMHPGQYTVLNSLDLKVVKNAILDLEYHEKILSLMDLNYTHKIVLHIGGIYGDKESAILRFLENYQKLNSGIKKRLVIENDDKSYNIMDVLVIGEKLKIPVVFDNLHNYLNPSSLQETDVDLIKRCAETWGKEDGTIKVHYSNQDNDKRRGSHSQRISLIPIADFIMKLEDNVDIMLEVKDKNISAIKCNNIFIREKRLDILFWEWQLYKYKILECSKQNYLKIENLLERKNPNFFHFYLLIDESLFLQENEKEALKMVFSIIKNKLSKREKESLTKKISHYQKNELEKIKKLLFQKVLKYEINELFDSYYFVM